MKLHGRTFAVGKGLQMIRAQYLASRNKLLAAFEESAPSAACIAALRAHVIELESASEHEPRILCAIAGAIIDGLSYGNWIGLSQDERFVA